MRAYFDNASTTPLLPEVIEEMTKVMKENFGNPSSIHFHGRSSRALLEGARKTVATILGTSIGEIFFTSCATEANNMILKMAAEHLHLKTILYSPLEHHCVLHTIDHLVEKNGIIAKPLKVDPYGKLDEAHLRAELASGEGPLLVSVMHGNNEIGVLNDIASIGEICEEYQVYFHSDMVQTIGKYPLNLQNLKVHFASGSAHKFHGPKGVGFAYIRNDSIIPPFIHGGAQERNMRAGTENLYGIVGLAKALELSSLHLEKWSEQTMEIRDYFIERLDQEVDHLHINGDPERKGLYHIASVSFPAGPKADLLMFNLDIAGISASSGSACSSGIESTSHVLKAIGHDPDRKTIRFSFSHYNTKDEVDYAVDQIKRFYPSKTPA